MKWDGLRVDLAGFRVLGFQQHGLAAPPRFMDPDGGNLTLRADDPGIDHGVYLPGINDDSAATARIWARTSSARMGTLPQGIDQASGLYLCRLRLPAQRHTGKLLLLR